MLTKYLPWMMPKQKRLREIGFGTVLTHVKDGIARGTGAVVTWPKTNDNLVFVKEKASAHYSLSRGTSLKVIQAV
jgi:hypothetical protein